MSNLIQFLKAILCILFSFTFLSNSAFANETPENIPSSNNCELALELSLFQEDNSPRQYNFYTVEAILDNVGPEAIGDILIDFSRPDGVVYKGSDPFDLSHGTFTPHGSEEWKIEILESGERATLTVNYFLLSEEAPIADIDIVSCFGDSGVRIADLSISGLSVQNQEVLSGDILNYNFDLSNVGTEDVTSSFSVKSWISVDPILSNDDIQDGVVPTGNFASGLIVANVPGASRINENIEPGEYYLIVKVDGDDQVFEADETNNIVVSSIVVLEDSVPMPISTECASDIMPGSFLCSSADPGGELLILTNDNGAIIENRVNSLGQVDAEIIGSAAESKLEFVQGFLRKTVDGNIDFEIPVPTLFTDNFDFPQAAIEIDGGFLVLAFNNTFDNDGVIFDELYAVRTDSNLNLLSSNFIATGGLLTGALGAETYVQSFVELPNNTFGFFLSRRVPISFELRLDFLVIDEELNVLFENLVESGATNARRGTLTPLSCGTYERTVVEIVSGAYTTTRTDVLAFENNDFVYQSGVFEAFVITGLGTGRRDFRYGVRTNDGGILFASHSQELGAGEVNVDINTNVKIEKRNGANEILWEDEIQVQDPNLIEGIIEFDGRPMLILQQSDGVEMLDVDCLRDSDPELNSVDIALDVVVDNNDANLFSFYNITYLLFNEGEEMATNIVVDVPRPEEVVYRGGAEFDTNAGEFTPYGDQKWRVDEIAPGEELFLTISYFTLQEGEFLNYAEISQMDQEDADSTPGNGSCCEANEDDEIFFFQDVNRNILRNAIVQDEISNYPVELKSVSPNPTFAETIEAQIYSKDPGTQTLQCYNAVGGLEYTFEVNLESGWNKVPLEISKLIAGTYILHLTESNSRQPPIRFVVVGD